ncbi:hypothetical protein BpHYR1_049624 [Brachionus plicatilis]|uniref:Uncharacterized protein n=1 Tax=Brachionus plicatilis TaxID=10195 RepID=A0A3M7T2W6_BRAPC|nr:hypothetical protein BpHYR1_049624 [Brachionus plicatilis]
MTKREFKSARELALLEILLTTTFLLLFLFFFLFFANFLNNSISSKRNKFYTRLECLEIKLAPNGLVTSTNLLNHTRSLSISHHSNGFEQLYFIFYLLNNFL